MVIEQLSSRDLSDEMALQVSTLVSATWPPKKRVEKSQSEAIADFRKRIEGRQLFMLLDNTQLLGYAEIFPRTIYTDTGAMTIMALASVCVNIEKRGLGLGKQIVEACFRAIDKSEIQVSLFQTGVPGFYEKLNCRLVHNTFVDKTNAQAPDAYPFTDEHTMIYPASATWPSGTIDINGKGY